MSTDPYAAPRGHGGESTGAGTGTGMTGTAASMRSTVEEELRTQLGRAGSRVAAEGRAVAEALRSSEGSLSERGDGMAADVVRAAAGKIEGLAAYVDRAEPRALVDDLERTAGRRPWLAASLAAAAGFMASRVMRGASDSRRARAAERPLTTPTSGGRGMPASGVPAP